MDIALAEACTSGNKGKTDIFFRELGNFTNHKWQRLHMLESRYFANFMKIDIALVQSYMNLALTINVFQVEFENTIHPQSLECHIIFSPSSTPSLPNCKLSLFSNADQEMTLYCPKHCLIMKKLVLLLGAFALIGCGEKKETNEKSWADRAASP